MKLALVALILHSSINTGIQPATVKNGVYNKIRATKTENMMFLFITLHSNQVQSLHKFLQISTELASGTLKNFYKANMLALDDVYYGFPGSV